MRTLSHLAEEFHYSSLTFIYTEYPTTIAALSLYINHFIILVLKIGTQMNLEISMKGKI